VAKYFGPIVSKNNHSYIYSQDLVLIEKVEKLWMVIHQKHYVCVTWVVSLGFVKRVTMQIAGKHMNWAYMQNGQTRSNNDEKGVF
jgi:hypothetical protein